jgi:LysR family transcriptional regulator, glycine cleavage system transcriptional activator
MSRRLPPLNAVRAFEAAARCGNFTRAAQELFVTQGAVSRHVATLEDWLKVRLFDRTGRGITLTPQGQLYYAAVRDGLEQIEHGTRLVQRSPDERRLRIKLPPTFAIRWLMPRLARFHARHPDIDVQITTSHQRADFDREDVDVSIHSERTPPQGAGCRKLFGETLLPVCAPGLLESGPPLRVPDDLAQHVLLCSMNRPNDWPAWLKAAGARSVNGNSGLKFENAALAYQAAADQLGVIVALLPFVRDDLAAGRLVEPFGVRVETQGAYWLTSRSREGAEQADRVKAFEEWILGEASEDLK